MRSASAVWQRACVKMAVMRGRRRSCWIFIAENLPFIFHSIQAALRYDVGAGAGRETVILVIGRARGHGSLRLPDKLLKRVTRPRYDARAAAGGEGHFRDVEIAARIGANAVRGKEIAGIARVIAA